MTSIDDLFRRKSLSSTKRKEPPTNPDELYKAAKHATNGAARGGEHHERPEVRELDDALAGPTTLAAEGGDEEAETGQDDDEGRFFGGGVTRDTKHALDFMDGRDGENDVQEKIDAAWLRRTALSFEKRISKNAELRAKFEDNPQKFMASEADLDADIKALSILTDHPDLYAEFAKLGCVASLVSLLSHDNTDIAINAMEILSELTDEDVQADPSQWNALVSAMLHSDLPDLLTQNLSRLDESNDSDRSGVYHSLSLIENLASHSTTLDDLLEQSQLLPWLLSRIQQKEKPTSQNKQYAAEVLAIIMQSSQSSRNHAIGQDAVDTLLQLLSLYRKRDPPKNSEEEEFAENVFDCLTCLVERPEGEKKFVDAEGIELCLIMMKEGKFSKPRALRVLDHAMGGTGGGPVPERMVNAAGLKPLFKAFTKSVDQPSLESTLGIFASLLRQLSGNSAPRIRTLAKFMENDYAAVQKLAKHRREYLIRMEKVDAQIRQEKEQRRDEDPELLSDEWLSRRLDAGLFCLQTVDVVLAWLIVEDAGARKKIQELLVERNDGIGSIQNTLKDQLSGLKHDTSEASMENVEMLKTLIDLIG